MADPVARTNSIDLHVHSNASDGLLPPEGVVELASALGLRIIALTDHDTTQGVEEAVRAGDRLGIEVIPGVELSTTVDAGELHMLGYFIDPHSPAFEQQLVELRDARSGRADRMVERLSDLGVEVDLRRVRELAGIGSIGRPHVARAMIEAGYVSSIDEAFERYLSRGRPAYVARMQLTPGDAVGLVHSAGGVAVLAHPFSVDNLNVVLPRLVEAGLDGMEVFYSLYNTEQRTHLAEIAGRFSLVATGGSDFHGSGEREGRELGTANVPQEAVDQLREGWKRRH